MADNFTTTDASNTSVTLAAKEDGSGVKASQIVSVSAAPTVTLTRPANTTAYTANDAIGTGITFSGMGRQNGGCGLITGAKIIMADPTVIVPEIHLWLFDTAPGATTDNAAFDVSDADALTFVGLVVFTPAGASDSASNRVYQAVNTPIGYKCASGATSLFGLVKTMTGFTPLANSSTLKFVLDIVQES